MREGSKVESLKDRGTFPVTSMNGGRKRSRRELWSVIVIIA
jgi:hypothetical protein